MECRRRCKRRYAPTAFLTFPRFLLKRITRRYATREFTDDEIEGVVRSLPLDKAPGPDGLPALFYKHYWSSCKKDVIAAVKHVFRHNRYAPPQWKATFITLIPKL